VHDSAVKATVYEDLLLLQNFRYRFLFQNIFKLPYALYSQTYGKGRHFNKSAVELSSVKCSTFSIVMLVTAKTVLSLYLY